MSTMPTVPPLSVNGAGSSVLASIVCSSSLDQLWSIRAVSCLSAGGQRDQCFELPIDRLCDACERRIVKLTRNIGEGVVGELRHALPILIDTQACRNIQASRSILSQHVF